MRNHALFVSCGIVVVALLAPARAPAAVDSILTTGSVSATTSIKQTFCCSSNEHCANAPASRTFSLSPGPTSVTVDQPSCTFTISEFTASASNHTTASVSESVSGSQHTFTFTFNGSASAHCNFPSTANDDIGAISQTTVLGSVIFHITGHAEQLTINPNFSHSGFRSGGFVTLSTPTGDFRMGHDGLNNTDLTDTLPRSSVQPLGSYSVQFSVNTGAREDQASPSFNAPEGSMNMTVTVTVGSSAPEFHWVSPAGVDFNVVTNWDPQQVPTSSDTAIFDLSGNDSPIPILGRNNNVGRMLIRRMNVDLNGPVQASGDSPSFLVSDGGTLVLDNGVQFVTKDADIGGDTGTESSVFVSGAGTKFTNSSNALLIGNTAPGKVVVDQNGVLASNKDITVGAQAAGTLRVESGGQVFTPNCTLNKGSIQVRGAGTKASNLDIASNLNVSAKNGAASLLIENSGTVKATQALIGDALATGAAAVTISDANAQGGQATLTTDGTGTTFQVAGSAGAQVDVKDGGALNTAGDAQIGANLAIGKVLVHGKHDSRAARWDVARSLLIGGKFTASELAISDGGQVEITRSFQLGSELDELGSATISGEGSVLSAGFPSGTGDFGVIVGLDGKGTLDITDGAHVLSRFGNVGVSRLAVGVDPPPTSGGTGQGIVTIGDNSLADAKWLVSGDCFVGVAEPGTIILKGLTLGPINLGGATLEVLGTLQVDTQGLINGSGKIVCNDVRNFGTISPGLSPGTITIEGNYVQKPEGVLKVEMASLDEGQFDVLNVTGDATLNGTLEVHMLNGFLLKTGDSVDFLQVGGNVSGDFSQITFPELSSDFEADLKLTSDGKLRLTARTDATNGDGASINPPADLVHESPVKARGLCGLGSVTMLPLTMTGLAVMRRRK